MLANFAIVYVANFIGAAGLAAIVALSGHAQMGNGAIGRTAMAIAAAKVALPFGEAFFRGVLCNVLVCLAVWIAMAGRTVTDKILAIIFPIAAFVAAGFEHSVATPARRRHWSSRRARTPRLEKIAQLTQATDDTISPLQIEILRVSRIVPGLALALGVIFFFAGQAIGLPFWAPLIFAIGIIVTNVPEAHGETQRADPPFARGRGARLHHGHLHGQDRYAHAELHVGETALHCRKNV